MSIAILNVELQACNFFLVLEQTVNQNLFELNIDLFLPQYY